MDRRPYDPKKGKEVDSVYRQKSEKREYSAWHCFCKRLTITITVISQSRVHDLMLQEDDDRARREEHDGWNIGRKSKSVLAGFLTLAFHVLSLQ